MAAGLAAFERQPPSLVSVLDLTESADVAKGVFYLHFASKDDFLLRLLEYVQGQFFDQVEAALRADAGGSTSQRTATDSAAAIISQYAQFADHSRSAVCFAMRMASYTGSEIGPVGELLSLRDNYLRRLAAVLADGSGEGDPMPTAVAAASVMDACCWGLLWQCLHLSQPLPSPQQLVDTVLPAIQPLLTGLRSDDRQR